MTCTQEHTALEIKSRTFNLLFSVHLTVLSIVLSNVWMIVNNELQRMWKEGVTA
jgi:hypothetical protein